MQKIIWQVTYRVAKKTVKKIWPFFIILGFVLLSIFYLIYQQFSMMNLLLNRPSPLQTSFKVDLFWPVQSSIITSHFGTRTDPFTGERSVHNGMDIGAPKGTAVFAAHDGKVITAQKVSGYGETVMIQYQGDLDVNIVTLYGHLSGYTVEEGDSVKQGDVIGLVGNTGRSTGDHLHFGVQIDGQYVDPFPLLFIHYAVYKELEKEMYSALEYVVRLNKDGEEVRVERTIRVKIQEDEFDHLNLPHIVQPYVVDRDENKLTFEIKGLKVFLISPSIANKQEFKIDEDYIDSRLRGYEQELEEDKKNIEIDIEAAIKNLFEQGGF